MALCSYFADVIFPSNLMFSKHQVQGVQLVGKVTKQDRQGLNKNQDNKEIVHKNQEFDKKVRKWTKNREIGGAYKVFMAWYNFMILVAKQYYNAIK